MDTSQIIARVAGVVLLLLGFAMLTAGVALLIGGDVTFKSGRRLAKPISRKIGILFVSFFPVVLILNAGLRLLDPDRAVPAAILNWPIALVCLGLGLVWLRRGLQEGLPPVVEVTPVPPLVPAKPLQPSHDVAPLPEFDGPAAKPRLSTPRRNDAFDLS
jgi:hypothetical protein